MAKGCSEKEWSTKERRKLRRAAHMAVAAGKEPPDDKAFGGWPYSPSDGVVTCWQRRPDDPLRKKLMRK